jgi:hypothetical protein
LDGKQVQLPEKDMSVILIGPTQVIFKVVFDSLDNPQAISLSSSTEQDLLVVQFQKSMIINGQDGVSLILDKSDFNDEDSSSFYGTTTLEP